MAYGGNVSSDAVNAHKTMAGAMSKGDFGVPSYPGRVAKHPDVGMKHDAMPDSARMPAHSGSGRLMQGSADHGVGKGHPDHFKRDGMV